MAVALAGAAAACGGGSNGGTVVTQAGATSTTTSAGTSTAATDRSGTGGGESATGRHPTPDARHSLPSPHDFGTRFGPTVAQDFNDQEQLAEVFSAAHCQPIETYRTMPLADGGWQGYHTLASQQIWSSTDTNPELATPGDFQVVTAYAQTVPNDGAGLYQRALARVTGCAGAGRTAYHTASTTGPPGLDGFAAFTYTENPGSDGSFTTELLLFSRGDTVVVARVATEVPASLGPLVAKTVTAVAHHMGAG